MKQTSTIIATFLFAASAYGDLEKTLTPQRHLKDYGLKDYVYTSKDLPHSETAPWKLVCQLPYNAQYLAWIQLKADEAGEVIVFDSSNPLVRAQQAPQQYTTVAGTQAYEIPNWISGEGAIYTIPAGVTVEAVKYRETGYDTEFTGAFTCNDNDYNLLWQKATRTAYLCMRDHYMDCPDRERREWLGDAVLEMEEGFYAFGLSSHEMAKRLILSKQVNGLPGQDLIAHGEYGDWGYYLYTGDLETLSSVYSNTKQYLAQYQIGPDGVPEHLNVKWDWYDWGTGFQDKTIIQIAEYYSAISALKKMAHATGHKDDIPAIEAKRDGIKKNFDRLFWKSDGYRSGSELDERANAMAVCSGLADRSKWETITKLIGTNGNCGPYFERWVLEALCTMDQPDKALQRMANRYQAQINAHFTTLWEYMDRASDGKKATDAITYVTLNHAWNSPNTILSKFIAGVAPESPGWSTYHVLPQEAFLTASSSTVQTVKGVVEVSIKKTASTFTLSLVSPPNTEAIVGIPKGSFTSLDSITVNGTSTWKDTYTRSVQGVSPNVDDARYVTFKVRPGKWEFVGFGKLVMTTPKHPAVLDNTEVKLNQKSWTATAFNDNQTFKEGPWKKVTWDVDAGSSNALDGDPWTGWRSMQNQVPGQWFIVDMQQPKIVNKVVMDNVWAIYDSPAGYAIYLSDDNVHWGTSVASGIGDPLGMTTVRFPNATGRYLKIEQTGTKAQVWSIFELNVYGEAKSK